jgi:hypothetical protein
MEAVAQKEPEIADNALVGIKVVLCFQYGSVGVRVRPVTAGKRIIDSRLQSFGRRG